MQFYDPSSQDATVDSDVSESSESEAAMSDSAQSNSLLQHLEDAEMVEFEMMNRGVKYTTDGRAGWTLALEIVFQLGVKGMIAKRLSA